MRVLSALCSRLGVTVVFAMILVLAGCTPRGVCDPAKDFILDHPLFEEQFGVQYDSTDVIPDALDVRKVIVYPCGCSNIISIETADDIQPCLDEYGNAAQFGVFIDRYADGKSDFLIFVSGNCSNAILITRDFQLVDYLETEITGSCLNIRVATEYVGDYFNWIVFTGFALPPGQPFWTPLPDVSIAPIVDFAYSPRINNNVMVETAFDILLGDDVEGGLFMYFMQAKGSPVPPGTARTRDINGDRKKDWLLADNTEKFANNVTVEMWIISTNATRPSTADYFAILVYTDTDGDGKWGPPGEPGGWVAKCPYDDGASGGPQKTAGPGNVLKKIVTTVTDGGADDDKDGKQDSMTYEYDATSGKVKATNKETPAGGGAAASTEHEYPSRFAKPKDIPRKKEDFPPGPGM